MPQFPDIDVMGAMFFFLLLLVILTLSILVLAIYNRWYLKQRNKRERRLRQHIGDRLIRYISGDLSARDLVSELKTRMDYIILIKLVYELDHAFDGVEEERLQVLMESEPITRHFRKYLLSGNTIHQAKSCMFLSRKKSIPPNLLNRLIVLTAHKESMLAYVAATAVFRHGSIAQKEKALRNTFQNGEMSLMALSDLMVKFTTFGEEYLRLEMHLILRFIRDESLAPDRRALLITILDEMEYFHSLESLQAYYEEIARESVQPELLVALIRILAKFRVEEILPDIHQNYTSSEDPVIRAASAGAMGLFRKPGSIPYLKWLVNDSDSRVRLAAIRALGKYPEVDVKSVKCEVIAPGEWGELVREIDAVQAGG